jgi:tRNA threonylcarbamoyladenosine biosynthesis protein TsaE
MGDRQKDEAPHVVRLRSSHHDATAAVGHVLADVVEVGDVIILTGALGAGKTRFVQGLAAGLGVTTRVTSPTFVLVRRHVGRIPLVHVDAYRLAGPSDLLALDDEVLDASVLTCIEWGETVLSALPGDRLDCSISIDGRSEDAPRAIRLTAHGARWMVRLDRLRSRLERLVADHA